MRKEVLIAVLIGFGIGLVVTLGIFTARKALTTTAGTGGEQTVLPAGEPQTPTGQTVSPAPQVDKEHSVTVVSPNGGSVAATEKISLSGLTTAGSTIAIFGGETDIVVISDDKGQFSAEVTLIGGDNEIKVVSFSPKGERAETVVTVVYSTAEF